MSFKEFLDCNKNKPVTQAEINALEKYLDKVWKNLGIDFEFTRHFIDRLNDRRNGEQITACEIKDMFVETFKKFGKSFAKVNKDVEAVLTDTKSDINIPFGLNYNRAKKELELVSITVMRKKNFKPNKSGEVHVKI